MAQAGSMPITISTGSQSVSKSNHIYSPSKNAFYISSLQDRYVSGVGWPEDAVDIDDEVFYTYIGTPPQGKIRGAGPDGMPAWVDAPPITTVIESESPLVPPTDQIIKTLIARIEALETKQV
jgi:hypothetical protein